MLRVPGLSEPTCETSFLIVLSVRCRASASGLPGSASREPITEVDSAYSRVTAPVMSTAEAARSDSSRVCFEAR